MPTPRPTACSLATCLATLLLMAWLVMVPGCSSLEDLVGLRQQAVTERDRLDQQAIDLQSTLGAIPPDDPARPALEAQIAQARAQADLYNRDVQRLDQVLAEARSPTDPIAQAVGVVAPFLPVPIRTPLVLGAALLGTVLRMHQLRQGLTSVARGFEIAKRDDPEFNSRFAANASTFRATQTPLARKLISQVVKGAPA